MNEYIHIFLISMVPILELRASIALGFAGDLPWYNVMAVSIIGNMVPVPFILLFIRKILHSMKKVKFLQKPASWIESKGEKNKEKIMKYAFFGLVLFVGIPLPGTGAWTGALAAAMVDMRMKSALPAIFVGVLLSALIMTLATYGFLGFLSFLV